MNLCSENKHFQTAIKHSVVAGCCSVSSQPKAFTSEFLELAKLWVPQFLLTLASGPYSPHRLLDLKGCPSEAPECFTWFPCTILKDDIRSPHSHTETLLPFMAGNTERKETKRINGSKLQNKDINDSGYEFHTIKKKSKLNSCSIFA